MPTVAEALRQHVPAYYAKFGNRIPFGHRKVLDLIQRCRTGELGGVLHDCQECHYQHWVGRSCGNRHCPNCGHHKTIQWLAQQTDKLLPIHHFLVTVTVPDLLRPTFRAHQSVCYPMLMGVASQTIRDVAGATRSLRGCELGFFAALHTWGRDPMVYHPHVHFVVPGGGVRCVKSAEGEDDRQWCSTPKDFLMHHGTAIRVFKAKFADAMREAKLYNEVPSRAWRGQWVIDIEPVGDGRAVLKYLAPYIHRIAISNKRILAIDEHSVTYNYTPSGTKMTLTRNVTGEEFVRGFAQHILPPGFQKIRYYGWMHGSSQLKIQEVKWLHCIAMGWYFILASAFGQPTAAATPQMKCPKCGGPMAVIDVCNDRVIRPGPAIREPDRALAYYDSG